MPHYLKFNHTPQIIKACEKHKLSNKQTAYVLATAYWETARTMNPVKEAFWKTEEWRKENLRYYPWYGRGFVQLTWEENYKKAGKKLACDLCTDPNAALDPDIAAEVLVLGSKEGWFTGKKLEDFINETNCDYHNARTIINGHDKAAEIAELAEEYLKALCHCD